jgi:hypothetical protein
MLNLPRTDMSQLLNRALLMLPVTLVVAAACSSGKPSSGATGSGEDGGGGNGTGTASSSGAGSGDDDSGTGNSSGSTASNDSGSTGTSSSGGGSASSGGSSGGHGSGSSSSGGGSDASSSSSGGPSSSGDGGATNACTMANASCTCSNNGCDVGSYYLYDNQWNCGSGSGNDCGPESAYGCANSDGTVDFVVTSNQPAGNTAVLSYPAMQDNFGTTPALSSFTTISATFEETSPHVGDYEVAWDCWFNNNANEFMVWVDNYNQTPGGSRVASDVSVDGRSWDVWWSPSTGTGGYVVFYANTTVTSGTVNLLALFQYGASHGWLPSTSTVDQVSFGTEVCSTNGKDATWTFSNYSITTN